MVFSSNKPLKVCPICKTELRNLANHIANKHPSEFARMENINSPLENSSIIKDEVTTPPPLNNNSNLNYRGTNFREILNEKLDQILSIKVIQMLEKGATIQDIQSMINPPQSKTAILEELKAYKDLFANQHVNTNPINVSVPVETDDSNQWLSLINNALPIVQNFLPKREEKQNDTEYRSNQARDLQDSGQISNKIAGNTTKSNIVGEESGIIVPINEQDDREPKHIDRSTIQ